MANQPLRVGMIGAGGRWGPRAHVPALKGTPEAELYAVCTAHADTAQAAADKFKITRAYGSDAALHADKDVEVALVAVRVPAHYACELECAPHLHELPSYSSAEVALMRYPFSFFSSFMRPRFATASSNVLKVLKP